MTKQLLQMLMHLKSYPNCLDLIGTTLLKLPYLARDQTLETALLKNLDLPGIKTDDTIVSFYQILRLPGSSLLGIKTVSSYLLC